MQMVKAHTMSILVLTKEQLKHYCFEQKRPGTDSVALFTLVYIVPLSVQNFIPF